MSCINYERTFGVRALALMLEQQPRSVDNVELIYTHAICIAHLHRTLFISKHRNGVWNRRIEPSLPVSAANGVYFFLSCFLNGFVASLFFVWRNLN